MDKHISVIEKPEWISYDDIADLLHEAHKRNVEKGMLYSASHQSGEEIQKLLHENGMFYVALTDDNQLAGVSALELFPQSNKWYGKKQPYGKVFLIGVLPAYQGMGVASKLLAMVEEKAFQSAAFLELDTAEGNKLARTIYRKWGWLEVDCLSRKTNNFYSVVMVKWKSALPFSKCRIWLNYKLRRIKKHILYDCFGKRRDCFERISRGSA